MVSLGVFYKKRVGYSSDTLGSNDYMYDYDGFNKGLLSRILVKTVLNLFKGIQITKTSNDAHYHVFLANVGLSTMIRLISPEIHPEKHQYLLPEVRLV